jgi:(1->4)-alpha-D-glucan 1-alpha-D-glucosylmutase
MAANSPRHSADYFEARPRGYRIPLSTYRLQLNGAFTFRDAFELAPYLHELGVSDCYASPIFAARPGSSHGYDTCDFTSLNPVLGTQEDFDAWIERLRSLGMGLLLDMVPNHMAADPLNPWWRDVLRKGESSKYANWFDIDWRPRDATSGGKVLLPILEDHYFKVLESGKLQIVHKNGSFALAYHEQILPLSPDSETLLEEELFALCRQDEHETEAMIHDNGSLSEILPSARASETAEGAATVQAQQQTRARQDGRSSARERLRRALREINGTAGRARSFDRLHALVQQQHYRLTCWRLSSEEINYRRFFDIGELVSLRMEMPEVFQPTHELALRLLQEGKVTGLRIDHPDGLWNPKEYFLRLQQRAVELGLNINSGASEPEDHAGAALRSSQGPLYIIAEKILSAKENLPQDWPIAGTTGYDFLNHLTGLFVNSANRVALDDVYRQFTGNAADFRSVVHAVKKQMLRSSMRSDLGRLTYLLRSAAAQTRYGLDFGKNELEAALMEIIAAFPVYRTYITEESEAPSPQEREFILEAIRSANRENERLGPAVLEFIEALLLLSPPADLDADGRRMCRKFVMRFQQLTGPAMAKGLEDTAFYNFNRLISLNEVGGAPDVFGTDLEAFHESNRSRAERWPHSLLATATHDTKRGEDIRARLNVLSEMPEDWRNALTRWSRLNARNKTQWNEQTVPDANDEYLFYQILLGAWTPEAETAGGLEAFRQRISNYMLKAIREAKAHTSWTEPNGAYEEATRQFVESVLTTSKENPFLDDFMLFHRKIAFFGLFNSLAQVVLKMTAPGVPDFYQGTELWDYNMVDPDNRRPVDYETRRRLLAELNEQLPPEPQEMAGFLRGLLRNYQTGQIKLYLIWRTLGFRRSYSRVFEQGTYTPMFAVGPKKDHVCAFARISSGATAITVATRLVVGLTGGAERAALEPDVWRDTLLPIPDGKPGGRYRNVLTQQILTLPNDASGLPVREVLELLPVALLERID